ncbi:Phosphatidylinositol-4-phosphate 5-kinase [Nowakowskiella sp. JEL0407]|nr:Phosphatidylinositol-4-phosphate 5-kinase [Nowakowskiella sp. JEL0407]
MAITSETSQNPANDSTTSQSSSAPLKTVSDVTAESENVVSDIRSSRDSQTYPNSPLHFTKSQKSTQSGTRQFFTAERPSLTKEEKIERRHTVGTAGEIQELEQPQIIKSNSTFELIEEEPESLGHGKSLSSSSITPTFERRPRRQKTDREVLVGTPVKEGHQNYTLMYDMLTGIRISVSRCNARPMRELTEADFEAAHKLAFDVAGNELTPTSEYDFKFKDYAPWVFRRIREIFRVDSSDYLVNHKLGVQRF